MAWIKVLILAMIMSGDQGDWIPEGRSPLISNAIREVAFSLDVADSHTNWGEFPRYEYKWMLRTYKDCRNCPHSWERARFPTRGNIESWYMLHHELRRYVVGKKGLGGYQVQNWDNYLTELDRYEGVYVTLLQVCSNDDLYQTCSGLRQSLRDLKNRIGEEAFMTGYLPPHPVTYLSFPFER